MARPEFDWMREIQDVASRFKEYFEQAQHSHPEPPAKERQSEPPYDLYIDDGKVCVEIELAGTKKDEIRIIMAGDAVEVSGERTPLKSQHARTLRNGRAYGPFNCRINLPSGANLDLSNAAASYTDGILRIVFPQSGQGLGFSIPVE